MEENGDPEDEASLLRDIRRALGEPEQPVCPSCRRPLVVRLEGLRGGFETSPVREVGPEFSRAELAANPDWQDQRSKCERCDHVFRVDETVWLLEGDIAPGGETLYFQSSLVGMRVEIITWQT